MNEDVFEVEDTCLFCGEWIPEGRQVCPNCVTKVLGDDISSKEFYGGINVKRVF